MIKIFQKKHLYDKFNILKNSLVIAEIQIIYNLIFLIVILQTIVGVGVLVVGHQ